MLLLLLLLLFFCICSVNVHQRPVLPHGHAGQKNFVIPAGFLKLPHGLCPLDLLALRGAPIVVVVRRIRLPGRRMTVAERRQVADASALPHRRSTSVPSAGVRAAAVVR